MQACRVQQEHPWEQRVGHYAQGQRMTGICISIHLPNLSPSFFPILLFGISYLGLQKKKMLCSVRGRCVSPFKKCTQSLGEAQVKDVMVSTVSALPKPVFHITITSVLGGGRRRAGGGSSVPHRNKFRNEQVTIKQVSSLQDFSEPLGGECAFVSQSAHQFPNLFYPQNSS